MIDYLGYVGDKLFMFGTGMFFTAVGGACLLGLAWALVASFAYVLRRWSTPPSADPPPTNCRSQAPSPDKASRPS
jgi:hypothetical protein